ncbi:MULTISPECIES: PRD domain-containing protein [unclassified Microbacterium]|uniref:PRD domain-containing protein n=1 Tax=unclassified Microbacterium TaxID=2609290 RepID=UPI00301B0B17
MKVIRVLNNNAVIVDDEEHAQAVVLGKGIGHGRRPGDELGDELVDQRFVPGPAHSLERLAAVASDIPLDTIECSAAIARMVHDRLDTRITQGLVLSIADHLAFAVRRAQEGVEVDYPLRWEIAQLYPRELAVGREAVALANAELGVRLPPDEATSLALHIVNAQFASDGLQATIAMTNRIRQVLDIVSAELDTPLGEGELNVSRFVTHLRYLFVRIDSGTQFTDDNTPLLQGIREAHPRAYACAQRVRYVLELGGSRLSADETMYLSLHISRLVSATG